MARLGAHMSIQGGLPRAVERARAVDATALQVFVKSNSQWAARPLEPAEATAFRRAARAAGLQRHTIAHASYLLNLASPQRALREASIRALRIELERCDALGIGGLVLHPGSHVGIGEEAGLDRVARALDRALGYRRAGGRARGAPRARVLIELTAGQGSNLGCSFEQLAFLFERARSRSRLRVCFDTCHALAAGYEFRDAPSYRETFDRFDRLLGLGRLAAFHLNDSKTPLGSRRDRHTHIGEGEVGLEAFRLILNDRRFAELPMVLETPKGEDLAEDRRNLGVLRAMIGR
jgi:deoxyribonuclease-4